MAKQNSEQQSSTVRFTQQQIESEYLRLIRQQYKQCGKYSPVQRDFWRAHSKSVPGNLLERQLGGFANGIKPVHETVFNKIKLSLMDQIFSLSQKQVHPSVIELSKKLTGEAQAIFPTLSHLNTYYHSIFTEDRNIKYHGQTNMTREDIHIVKNTIKHKKVQKIFFSAIIPNSTLDKPFFNSIQTFLKEEGAELGILPMRGIHHTHKEYSPEVSALSNYYVTEHFITDKLKAMDAQIPPMSPDPIAISKRLAKNFSLIVAHPKQNMASLPVLDTTKPKVILSTGVLTKRKYPRTASGFKGELDSVLGGVIIETDPSSDLFFWRFVQANSDGSFYDLDKQYMPDGTVKKASAEYLYTGDVHSGFVLDYARKATIEMANALNVKTVGGGDWLDFYSASHHHEHNINVKVLKQKKRKDIATIESELDTLIEEIKKWDKGLNKGMTIDIIQSNHDEHLLRYLENQRFFNDVLNYRISLDLAGYYLDGKYPIQEYITKKCPELKPRINWVPRTQVKRVSAKKILVSQHGDLGPNGSKSTNNNAEWSYQECVLGHSHSPSVLRSVYRVGTLALGLEYQKGPSSWQVVNCVIFPNGARQLIWVAPDGRWRL
jgi:hypothetical protein